MLQKEPLTKQQVKSQKEPALRMFFILQKGPALSQVFLCPTCQPVVHHVVLLPEPQNSLVQAFHGIHGFFGHLLKMLSTSLAPKEVLDVPPHDLQHNLGVVLKTYKTSDRHSSDSRKVKWGRRKGKVAPFLFHRIDT